MEGKPFLPYWTIYVNKVFCILLVIPFGVLISCLILVILSGQLAGVSVEEQKKETA